MWDQRVRLEIYIPKYVIFYVCLMGLGIEGEIENEI